MITTSRLRLRPWNDADRPFAHVLWGDPAVTRLIDARDQLDDDAVDARLAEEQRLYAGHGICYLLAETHDGVPVGACGLHPRGDTWELGFHIARSHWRNGYAREAARAVILWAFGDRGLASLYAGRHPDNAASAKLLAALGFQRTGEDLYPPTGLMHPAYRLTAPEAVGAKAVYNLVAEEYVERLGDELDGKPFDRDWLTAFASRNRDVAIADIGCGPGHVARFLADAGAEDVVGIDLAARMIDLAAARYPDLFFEQGDMDALPRTFGAILAMYSIVNRPTATLPDLFAHWRSRVDGGAELGLAFHCGDEIVPIDEWWDHKVLIDFAFHATDAVVAALERNGWDLVDVTERDSYGLPIEYPSRRAYIRATARAHICP